VPARALGELADVVEECGKDHSLKAPVIRVHSTSN
jgi:hypothetical protein